MADLSKLSDHELELVAQGKMNRVSDATLALLAAEDTGPEAPKADAPVFGEYLDPLVAGGAGFARGATFGLSKRLEPKSVAQAVESSPISAGIGEAASFFVPGAGPAKLAGLAGRGVKALGLAKKSGGLTKKLLGAAEVAGTGAAGAGAEEAARSAVDVGFGDETLGGAAARTGGALALGGVSSLALRPVEKAVESFGGLGEALVRRSVTRPSAKEILAGDDKTAAAIKYGITGTREEILGKAKKLAQEGWAEIQSSAKALDNVLKRRNVPGVTGDELRGALDVKIRELGEISADPKAAEAYLDLAEKLGAPRKKYSIEDLVNIRKQRYGEISRMKPKTSGETFIDSVANQRIEAEKLAIRAIDDLIEKKAGSLGEGGSQLYRSIKEGGEKYGAGVGIGGAQEKIEAAERAIPRAGSKRSAIDLFARPINWGLSQTIDNPGFVSGPGAALARNPMTIDEVLRARLNALVNRGTNQGPGGE